MFVLLIIISSKGFSDFVNDILSSLHFDSFNWRPSAREFVTNSSTRDCIDLDPFFSTHSARVVPSTYFQMFVFATLRSLIINRNNQGLSLVGPWTCKIHGSKTCKIPGSKTTSLKRCLLTKNCSCFSYSQIISCCAGVVGTCRLNFRNIQVLFITEKIFYITRTPRNCRCWVSFRFTFKWCILFTANKDFLCKFNHRRNCNELKKKNSNKNETNSFNEWKYIWSVAVFYGMEKWSLHLSLNWTI